MNQLIASEGTVVELAYTISNQNGEILDRRFESRPAQFLFGYGQVLPQIENAIDGKGQGFIKTVIIPETMAFGPYDESLVTKVHRSALPEQIPLKVGTRFKTAGPGNRKIVIRVVAVEGDEVILDGNHPLAGNDLHIDLKILAIRTATEDELANGSVSKSNIDDARRMLH